MNQNKLQLSMVISCVLVLCGCTKGIPEQHVDISAKQSKVLQELKSVRISKPSTYDMTCYINRLGQEGYYLLSSGTTMSKDYAKWKCGGDNLSILNCPEMLISQEHDNISALIQVIDGAAEDYSLNDLKMCALTAIDNAPVKLIPTSEKVRNRDSYSKLSN
ncbi:hypothetical protein [Shewanella baltica]|uniref:hypothetical protein n=1 Tax=Shewanella baltica TaxID=62322 RepID=UPI00217CC7A5|nr:hypothetical protein [Shewanella baltica]MCS6210747.1 hypothetical protein [Shewanella baltica]